MAHKKEVVHLPVLSVFYGTNRSVNKKIRSAHPINAVKNAVAHMRRNLYEATVAEVYSTVNGRLYAVMKRDIQGNTHVLYEHEFNSRKDQ